MAGLQLLVRNLIVILLLATFVEMLLPSAQMQRFVRLIMGLFVIAAVLQPVNAFLHTPLAMDIPAWVTPPRTDVAVWAGEEPEQAAQGAIVEHYRSILSNEIRSLALGVNGVRDAQVSVRFVNDQLRWLEQPDIASVTLTLTLYAQAAESSGQQVSEKMRVVLEIPVEKIVLIQKWE
ncbi:MAG: stage III sporulation protein AF [Peptococcaceae bacterium]|nr:stage III sporulation protein AF [Peptococcaceae bacterium]